MTEIEELRLAYAECSRQRNELLTAHKRAALAAPQPEPRPVLTNERIESIWACFSNEIPRSVHVSFARAVIAAAQETKT